MIISVRVKPNAKKPEVETGDGKSYSVKVDAPPESGKANRRFIEILADYFGVPKSSVSIIRGFTGKDKLVAIADK